MRSAALIVGLLAIIALIGSGYIAGRTVSGVKNAEGKTETLKRIQNADVSEDDPDADRDWLDSFLNRMSAGR